MKIQYYVKSVYGNERNYIADPVIAQAITNLTEEKTLSFKQISALECLGHSFEQVLSPGSRRPNFGATVVPATPVLDFATVARSICHPDSR